MLHRLNHKAANVFSLSFPPCLYRPVLPQISLGGFTLLCQTVVTFQLGGLVLNGSGILFDAPLDHLSPHLHFGKECHYLITMLVSATCIVQYSSSSHSLSATSTWKASTKKMPLSFLLLEMNLHTFLSLSISWIS